MMVEAAGIEPASEAIQKGVSTSLAYAFGFSRSGSAKAGSGSPASLRFPNRGERQPRRLSPLVDAVTPLVDLAGTTSRN